MELWNRIGLSQPYKHALNKKKMYKKAQNGSPAAPVRHVTKSSKQIVNPPCPSSPPKLPPPHPAPAPARPLPSDLSRHRFRSGDLSPRSCCRDQDRLQGRAGDSPAPSLAAAPSPRYGSGATTPWIPGPSTSAASPGAPATSCRCASFLTSRTESRPGPGPPSRCWASRAPVSFEFLCGVICGRVC
jgi:hypothetical protein